MKNALIGIIIGGTLAFILIVADARRWRAVAQKAQSLAEHAQGQTERAIRLSEFWEKENSKSMLLAHDWERAAETCLSNYVARFYR